MDGCLQHDQRQRGQGGYPVHADHGPVGSLLRHTARHAVRLFVMGDEGVSVKAFLKQSVEPDIAAIRKTPLLEAITALKCSCEAIVGHVAVLSARPAELVDALS